VWGSKCCDLTENNSAVFHNEKQRAILADDCKKRKTK
jgi:hypothetical protein